MRLTSRLRWVLPGAAVLGMGAFAWTTIAPWQPARPDAAEARPLPANADHLPILRPATTSTIERPAPTNEPANHHADAPPIAPFAPPIEPSPDPEPATPPDPEPTAEAPAGPPPVPADTIERWISQLYDSDSSLALAAAREIEHLASRKGIVAPARLCHALLSHAVESSSLHPASATARLAMRGLQGPAVVPALLEWINTLEPETDEDGDNDRLNHLLWLLPQIEHPGDVAPLVERLMRIVETADPTSLVIDPALHALGRWGAVSLPVIDRLIDQLATVIHGDLADTITTILVESGEPTGPEQSAAYRRGLFAISDYNARHGTNDFRKWAHLLIPADTAPDELGRLMAAGYMRRGLHLIATPGREGDAALLPIVMEQLADQGGFDLANRPCCGLAMLRARPLRD